MNYMTDTVFNTLRLTEKQRAGKVVKDEVLDHLRALTDCCNAMGAKHLAFLVGYGFKDFGEKYSSTSVDILCFVASIDDCRRFLTMDITQEELVRRSEALVYGAGATLKKVEITLE